MAKKRVVARFMHEKERQTIKEQNRSVEIIVTSEAPSTRQLLGESSKVDYDYQLTAMPRGTSSVPLPVVP